MDTATLKQYQNEVESEIKTNILPFWAHRAIDEKNGGFYGVIHNDLTPDPFAAKGSVLCSRILWTFARAYTVFEDKLYIDRADRAYDYLLEHFIDNDFGGIFWKVDYQGNPLDTKKQIYAQAFAIYALAEYYNAIRADDVLALAKKIFSLIEKFTFDEKYGGYFNTCSRDWSLAEDMQLGEKDLDAPKTMNTSLHILEGYTNLLHYWDDENLRNQLRDLIMVMMKYVLNPSGNHFGLYFKDNWEKLSDHISYGHDLEGSWLLAEAGEVLNDKSLIRDIKNTALNMADAVLKEGVAPDGGIWNEGNPEGIVDFNSDWWPQAEAIVGFLNAYELSGRANFLDASFNSWQFIKKYLIDRRYGEWIHSVDKNRNANKATNKADIWKCPYHNARACMEVRERIIRCKL